MGNEQSTPDYRFNYQEECRRRQEDNSRYDRLRQEEKARHDETIRIHREQMGVFKNMFMELMEQNRELLTMGQNRDDGRSAAAAYDKGNDVVVCVRFENNRISIECNDLDCVENIKDIVEVEKNINLNGYKIVFNGKELTTGSLRSHGIRNKSIVVVKKRET